MKERLFEADIHMVLAILGLSNPVSEALVSKYLIGGKYQNELDISCVGNWENLFIHMYENYIKNRSSISREEIEAMSTFTSECSLFIDKCIQAGVLQFSHPESELPCDPLDMSSGMETTPSFTPSRKPSSNSTLSPMVDEIDNFAEGMPDRMTYTLVS